MSLKCCIISCCKDPSAVFDCTSFKAFETWFFLVASFEALLEATSGCTVSPVPNCSFRLYKSCFCSRSDRLRVGTWENFEAWAVGTKDQYQARHKEIQTKQTREHEQICYYSHRHHQIYLSCMFCYRY